MDSVPLRLEMPPDSFLSSGTFHGSPHVASQESRPLSPLSGPAATGSTNTDGDSYLNELQSTNAKLERVFDQNLTFTPGSLVLPKKVAALLLYFESEGPSDMNCEPEVKELEKILKEEYRFDVKSQVIKRVEGQNIQLTFNKYLVDFVLEKDGEDTLLLVFYAGHGWRGKGRGDLQFMRRTDGPESDAVKWQYAEGNLMSAQASVLLILDCCDAGSIFHRRGSERPFEVIAATPRNSTTPGPGNTSFTSALMWALRQLAREHSSGFTASELRYKIFDAPNCPENLSPLHDNLRPRAQGKVSLAPLPESDAPLPDAFRQRTLGQDEIYTEYAVLHVPFTRRPTEGEIGKFSKEISRAITDSGLPTSALHWQGLWPWETLDQEAPSRRFLPDVVELAALRFLVKTMKRRLSNRPSPASSYSNPGAVLPLQVPQVPEIKVHLDSSQAGNGILWPFASAKDQSMVFGLTIIFAVVAFVLGMAWKL